MSWQEVELGDICHPKQHKTISANTLLEEGYPVFGANGQIGFYSAYTHDQDTIAITCRGATCGTVNLVPAFSYITGNAMALDKLDQARADINFLAYALRYRGLHDVISGSAQPQITRGPLLGLRIPLPPLEEQRRIAAILDQADALRRLRHRTLTHLNTLAQSIFHEMFGSREGWLNSHTALPISEICRPKQWKTISSSELLDDGYPVYGANGIIGFYSEYNHEKETVLITCRGATCGTINVCSPFSYVTGNAMALDDPDPDKLDLTYLEWALKIRGVDDAISGSAQPQITRQSLATVRLPIPPKDQQVEFSRKLTDIKNNQNSVERSREKLDALFTSLQHRAFRGEL